jgi:hypothetical protein
LSPSCSCTTVTEPGKEWSWPSTESTFAFAILLEGVAARFEWIHGDHFWRRRWAWRSLANGKCQFALSLAISPDVFGEAVGAGETANGFPVVTSIEQAEDFNLAILLQAVGAHF